MKQGSRSRRLDSLRSIGIPAVSPTRPCRGLTVLGLFVAFSVAALSGACSKEERPAVRAPVDSDTSGVRRDALSGGPCPTLLLSKAHFDYRTGADGRRAPVPGAARLVLVRKTDAGWCEVCLEDPESNVFHKSMLFDVDGEAPGILTIGGTGAALKVWRWKQDRWKIQTLWQPHFGGKWDRLRDVEVGDVTGDGRSEIVLATHDQGVVAVLSRHASAWVPRELDRAPRVFVHEIEIGDIDGDGLNEFFATPSLPNQATLVSQPGEIVMYRWNGRDFERTLVDAPKGTHAKEILAVDLKMGGRATLLAAIEGRTEHRTTGLATLQPVRIKAYRFEGERVASEVIATLDDRQCRCLAPGDVDGDGQVEVVAAGMTSGLWLLKRRDDGTWQKFLIDAQSSGYEHAALVADLEGDGRNDIFVASDVQRELRRYRWEKDGFVKTVITSLPENEITFHIAAGVF